MSGPTGAGITRSAEPRLMTQTVPPDRTASAVTAESAKGGTSELQAVAPRDRPRLYG